jgi:hypothetical protein
MSLFDWFKRRRQKQSPAPVTSIASKLIDSWRRIIIGDRKSWVLFRHGTCVILMQPDSDLRSQAVELLREWGPVHAGSPAGDFSTVRLTEHPGWVVTCHHKDILTYVAPEEMPSDQRNDLAIGLFGRSKRDQDAAALDVIHVEDKHNAA